MRPSSFIESKEVEHDPDDLQCAWDFIIEEHDALRRLCRQMSRGDATLAEDLWDVVTTYVPKAVACWDPDKGPLRAHIMRSVRMYAWKSANYRFAPGDAPLHAGADDESEHPDVAQVAANRARFRVPVLDLDDECGYILGHLDSYDRSLLTLYFLCGLPHEEVGAVLGVSKGTARVQHKRALERAQDVARRLYDDEGECFDPGWNERARNADPG